MCLESFITARVRRMGEGNIFSLCVSSHLDGGGGPHPPTGWGWYPNPRSGWRGTPNRKSIACTCYMAGGMPLAFMQDDFLVHVIFIREHTKPNVRRQGGYPTCSVEDLKSRAILTASRQHLNILIQ